MEGRLSNSTRYTLRILTKFETILHLPEVDNFIFETARRNHENSSEIAFKMAVAGWKRIRDIQGSARRKSHMCNRFFFSKPLLFHSNFRFPLPSLNFEITDIRHARRKVEERSPLVFLILMLIPFRFVRISCIFIRIFRKGTGHDRAETIVHEADFMAFQSVKRGKYINGGREFGWRRLKVNGHEWTGHLGCSMRFVIVASISAPFTPQLLTYPLHLNFFLITFFSFFFFFNERNPQKWRKRWKFVVRWNDHVFGKRANL